jgi:hypothetical protein
MQARKLAQLKAGAGASASGRRIVVIVSGLWTNYARTCSAVTVVETTVTGAPGPVPAVALRAVGEGDVPMFELFVKNVEAATTLHYKPKVAAAASSAAAAGAGGGGSGGDVEVAVSVAATDASYNGIHSLKIKITPMQAPRIQDVVYATASLADAVAVGKGLADGTAVCFFRQQIYAFVADSRQSEARSVLSVTDTSGNELKIFVNGTAEGAAYSPGDIVIIKNLVVKKKAKAAASAAAAADDGPTGETITSNLSLASDTYIETHTI